MSHKKNANIMFLLYSCVFQIPRSVLKSVNNNLNENGKFLVKPITGDKDRDR